MKTIFSASITAIMLWAGPASADIPVIDFSAIGNQIRQIAQDAKSYVVQGEQYITQARTLYTEGQMLIGFVHDPNLGAAMQLMNMAGLGNSLPSNPYAVQGLVNGVSYRGGGIPNINGVLGSLGNLSNASWSANHVYTPRDGSWRSQQLIAAANGISGTQGASEAAYQDYRTHADALQALRDRLSTAGTPKDVQDAQGEIALEQLWTNSQQGQLGAISIAYLTQRDTRDQQEREKLMESGEAFLDRYRAAGIIQ